MTWSAPSERSRSNFPVLSTAVTSAPKYLASCTANVPILPPAPLINTFCPLRILPLLRKNTASSPPIARVSGFLIGYIGRFYCQHPVFRQACVLSIRTQTQTAPSKNLVTLPESFYVFADCFNFSC